MGLLHKNDRKGANSGRAAEPYVAEGHGETDEQVRADVHERLVDEGTARALTIAVKDCVVTVGGEVSSEPDRQRLLAIVRAVPSVKQVEDQLRVTARSH
jgi:osmotically-inducible protein OsmY